jgi:hypothetical protein
MTQLHKLTSRFSHPIRIGCHVGWQHYQTFAHSSLVCSVVLALAPKVKRSIRYCFDYHEDVSGCTCYSSDDTASNVLY